MDNLKFIGLENYRDLFGDRAMKSALINTCFYSIVFPVIVTILAIPLSLALNSKSSFLFPICSKRYYFRIFVALYFGTYFNGNFK